MLRLYESPRFGSNQFARVDYRLPDDVPVVAGVRQRGVAAGGVASQMPKPKINASATESPSKSTGGSGPSRNSHSMSRRHQTC